MVRSTLSRRRWRVGATVCVVSMAIAVPASSATAATKTETASSGGVTAKFSYSQNAGSFPRYSNLHLVITRNGVSAFDGAVTAGGQGTGPGGGTHKSVAVRDLDGNHEPEVVLKLFTGGAHCCTLSAIYRHVSSGYKLKTHDWRDTGFKIKNVGGGSTPEFLSADARFAYKFTDFADSRFPIQIFRYKAGKLRDVTRHFRRLIRKDLKRQLKDYKQLRHTYPRGALAAAVADEYQLKRGAAAGELLRKALKHGDLRKRTSFDTPPYGKAYIRSLKRFLKRLGYRR